MHTIDQSVASQVLKFDRSALALLRTESEASTSCSEENKEVERTDRADKNDKKSEDGDQDPQYFAVADECEKERTLNGEIEMGRIDSSNEECTMHMTVMRGSVPRLHITLSCSQDFSKSVSLSLENDHSTSLENYFSFDKNDFSSTQVLKIGTQSLAVTKKTGSGNIQDAITAPKETASRGNQERQISSTKTSKANGIRDRRGILPPLHHVHVKHTAILYVNVNLCFISLPFKEETSFHRVLDICCVTSAGLTKSFPPKLQAENFDRSQVIIHNNIQVTRLHKICPYTAATYLTPMLPRKNSA